MKHFVFNDREGQTPLPPELRKGLIPKAVQSVEDLNEYEEANITVGLVWLEHYKKEDCLTSTFWLKLHKKLFHNVWKWAGKVRSHELENPDFKPPHQIWPEFKRPEDDLQYWIKNKTYSEKEFTARLHERIETIHPFPNGNGRFGRLLTEYICQKQGIPAPTWGASLKEDPNRRRSAYIDALNKARQTHRFEDLIKIMFT